MNAILSNRIIFILSLAGIGVSGYLTYGHLNHIDLGCTKFGGGCQEVASHPSAWGFGIPFLHAIPTAAFGVMMYVVLAAFSFVRVAAVSETLAKRARDLQWMLSLLGVLVFIYLVYLEAYVIRAWCQWCLASTAITVLIFLVSTAERFVTVPPTVQGEAT